MLERKSALAGVAPFKSSVLQMGEVRGFTLTQVTGAMPEAPALQFGLAAIHEGRTYMQVAPRQYWIITPEYDASPQGISLSSSRTRIFLEGEPARAVLTKSIPLDFHKTAFTPGRYALTGIHHTPVLAHCVSEHRFEILALRTYAVSVWDWLADAALEFADGSV